MDYKPEEEGTTHINCYSKARTPLGRWLSNFAHSPIETEDGHFESIEGYWYWLSCKHERKDELRHIYGWQAKQLGRELKSSDYPEIPDFKERIWKAVVLKINSNHLFRKELMDSDLPLAHYYVYGSKVHRDERSDWLWNRITETRDRVKKNQS